MLMDPETILWWSGPDCSETDRVEPDIDGPQYTSVTTGWVFDMTGLPPLPPDDDEEAQRLWFELMSQQFIEDSAKPSVIAWAEDHSVGHLPNLHNEPLTVPNPWVSLELGMPDFENLPPGATGVGKHIKWTPLKSEAEYLAKAAVWYAELPIFAPPGFSPSRSYTYPTIHRVRTSTQYQWTLTFSDSITRDSLSNSQWLAWLWDGSGKFEEIGPPQWGFLTKYRPRLRITVKDANGATRYIQETSRLGPPYEGYTPL